MAEVRIVARHHECNTMPKAYLSTYLTLTRVYNRNSLAIADTFPKESRQKNANVQKANC